MTRKTILFVLLAVLFSFTATAKNIGPDVSEYRGEQLKWEDGAYGYHVMFKSLIANVKKDAKPDQPVGDTCKDSATYTLGFTHIPKDAIVERAFLVWTSAQPAAKKDQITDNKVTLSFVSEDGMISENSEISGKKAYKIADAGVVSFEFDAFKDMDNANKSWYTYRVDITNFFKDIQKKGREITGEDSSVFDGYSLLGNYTLYDLDCTDENTYQELEELVADWSIILIYSSVEISPKKIYLYDGFQPYFHTLSEIMVTGFIFPLDPEIRVTLASHEGDSGLWNLFPSTGMLYPEGLQVQGDPLIPGEWLLISNECNPQAYADQNYVHLDYTEIFNSISSVYGWDDTIPTCIGGIPPVLNYEEIEYGIDVDTFIMDTSDPDSPYKAHFKKNGDHISFRIGANQDQVITNYMIVSVDTKAPQFDIPGYPEKVACTPSNTFDTYSLDGNWCQNNLEHTFALRIQNWGTDEAKKITVTDAIPPEMDYVAGSTEYAVKFNVEDGKKIATRWIPIPDLDGGVFPLKNGYELPVSLNKCDEDSDYLACEDLVMVRFRAKVKSGTPKNQIIENTALYKTPGVNDYKTNLGIPVKLKMLSAGCVASQDDVDLSECGGVGASACTKNDECGEGYICDKASGACIEDPSIKECQNATIKAEIGKNSPNSETIFISNPQTNLVFGQIELAGTGENCYLNLGRIIVKFNVNDSNIKITNLKMFKDANGNGKVDGDDVLISSMDQLDSNNATFSASSQGNRIKNDRKNYILFTLDVKYTDEDSIPSSAYFSSLIEKAGITISGNPQIEGSFPLEFSKFQFEPDRGFIVTKGAHDPDVPAKSEMNKFQDVMQLRLLAKGANDTLKEITIKTPSKFVNLSDGIKKIAIYEDTNNDGKGDRELAWATSFDSSTKHKFKINFDVPQNEEKYLTIKAEPSLGEDDRFQINVSSISVNELTVYGVPISSKIYEYSCDPNLEDCGGSDDDGGCSITASDDNSQKTVYAVLAAVLAILSVFALRTRRN